MAMLTMRARRFLKKTGRKFSVNGLQGTKKTGIGRPQEGLSQWRHFALISCDGAGYDWSDQAEEGPTNFALMAYSSTSSNSEVSTDSNCSSSCLENVKILKEQNKQLLKDLRTSKLNVIAYKAGLESIEARLLVYKKNESFYEEDIKILKREIHLRENSSKSLSKLLDCQIVDKCKTGLGYNSVPPPYTGNFMPPKLDLSFTGLEEFVNEPRVSESTYKKPVVETSEIKASEAKSKAVRNGAPIIMDWVSDNEEDDVPQAKIEKKTVKPSFAKIEFVKSKKQVKSPRKTTVNQSDQNSLNTQIPKETCSTKLIMKDYPEISLLLQLRPVNTAQPRTTVNSARPMTNVLNKAHLTVRRPNNNITATKNNNFNQMVNTIKHKNVNIAKPKAVVNTARPKAVLNAVKGNQVNAVKVSACWVWKPKTKVIYHVSKHNSASILFKRFDYIDAQGRSNGCSRHMTWNMSYLTDFEEIDGGYVAFGGNPKGRKITGKVPIKNNMYSVDLKNIVPKGGLNCLFAKATSDESKL
ncbi:hypothetical protein Tco_1379889 [Tanacetum coccineum]